jgi:hypothetical protein
MMVLQIQMADSLEAMKLSHEDEKQTAARERMSMVNKTNPRLKV